MKGDELYLAQIKDLIRKIESYVDGFDRAIFLTDEKTQSALLLQLLLIEETAKKISNETRERIHLPWKVIIGFRDRAIHNYFDADLNIVWNTVKEDIPILKRELEDY